MAIRRTVIVFCLAAVLAAAWFTVLSNTDDSEEEQQALIEAANEFLADGLYIRALPLLLQAADYKTDATTGVWYIIKDVYKNLGENSKYEEVLSLLAGEPSPPPELFTEAFEHYIARNRYTTALSFLKDGIAKTADGELAELYESNRYRYELLSPRYDDVTDVNGGYIQVKRGDHWGIAIVNGVLVIPCEYDAVSTMDAGYAVVSSDGELYTVDSQNRKYALLKDTEVEDFGNLSEGLLGIKTGGVWIHSTFDLSLGSSAFESIGMYSGGYTAICSEGKWGIMNASGEFLVPLEYDSVVTDELGRCYALGSAFLTKGGEIYLYSDGEIAKTTFEDALPFADGYAAVKKNGKWGFADTEGSIVIECAFDDARSFSQGLAAVKTDGMWGYINPSGDIVIGPAFAGAKSFYSGRAPVLTETGWAFLFLEEYS